ncbi:transporter substrate-binding domain-containing protein [Marinigracilibium pacificum]|uniref:Transporter substrate-binding domain-containing protein n=1 Tax=Marinigracilibium pacificum TaxID=2729599 RepID=A0A848IV20_9BACT|nr:transporter substrate-binding domain-containing protein [Marinigracilibium pacificum]NMM47135.1 transporter substrate-binding domain-containing protein [Marinigracilibium pacificum]
MTFFKRSLWLFFIAISTFYSFGQTTSFAEAKVKEKGQLNYYYDTNPGFINVSSGTQSGICADILTEFEKWVKAEYGITLVTNYVPTKNESFSIFLEKVKNGGAGIIGVGGVTITEERKKSYSFSHPYINNISIMVTHSSVPSLRSPEEMASKFSNMIALSVRGTTNEKTLLELKKKYFPSMRIEYMPSSNLLGEKISKDPKYFSIVDLGFFLVSLKEYRSVKPQPALNESNDKFGFIMPKDSDWAPILSKFIKEVYLNSSDYRKSIASNLGAPALKLLDSYAN